MATAVLIAGSTLIGGGPWVTAGATLGAALVGGYVDAKFVNPWLFPSSKGIAPPRLDGMDLQSGSEGSPINVLKGTGRLAGTIIWLSDLRENAIKDNVGKTAGGGKKKTVGYTYSLDAAIGICEGPVSALKKIYADGKLIYDVDINGATITSDGITVTGKKLYDTKKTDFDGVEDIVRHYLEFSAEDGGPDLSQFKSGQLVTVSGCSNPENDGEYLCLSSEEDAISGDTLLRLNYERDEVEFALGTHSFTIAGKQFVLYLGLESVCSYTPIEGELISDLWAGLAFEWNEHKASHGRAVEYTAVAESDRIWFYVNRHESGDLILKMSGFIIKQIVCTETFDIAPITEVAGSNITLTQTLPNGDETNYDDITFYSGSTTQNPDDLIEAAEGVDDVPAFRGISYIVFENLILGDYGNRLPQFNFVVESDASLNAADLIDFICDRAGYAANEYDTSNLAVSTIDGYIINSPREMAAALQDVLFVKGIALYEDEGVLKFKDRINIENVEVLEEDLAATDGEMKPHPFELKDSTDTKLPSEVVVEFFESDNEFQQASQSEVRPDGDYDNSSKIQLPIVMTAEEARAIAKRELWTAWAQRLIFSMSLPPAYSYILAGDSVTVTYDGEEYTFFVSTVTIGANGLVELTGFLYDESANIQTAAADSAPVNEQKDLYLPPTLLVPIIDIAPLRSEDEMVPGIYIAGAPDDILAKFNGGILYHSKHKINGYNRFSSIGDKAIIGEATTVLADADGAGISGVWDEVNTVIIKMFNGELENKTEEEVLSGENRALIGNEIIGFRIATLTGQNEYTLSGLMRGTRNTEYYMDKHVVLENFVLLDGGGVEFLKVGLSIVGLIRYYKPVANGGDVDIVRYMEKIFNGNTVRCWSPCHVKGLRSGSEYDLTVTWVRRTRSLFKLLLSPAPLIDLPEKYEVDIYNDADEIVRTFKIYISDPEQVESIGATVTKQYPNTPRIEYAGGTVEESQSFSGYLPLIEAHEDDNSINAILGETFNADFIPGMSITMTGWANPENNGGFKIVSINPGRTKMILERRNLVDEVPTINTIIVTGYAIYTGDQANDGLVPNSPIKMRLYQINSFTGRGKYKEENI